MPRPYPAIAVATGVAGVVSIALAFPSGAVPGVSGGPIGYQSGGGNCTACHELNVGAGSVELLGAPRRYRPGVAYDLTIRVADAEQAGAGFEISAEGGGSHRGNFELVDLTRTQFADFDGDYVTHTSDGVADSTDSWDANGGLYEYPVRWVAPAMDTGPVTLFIAAEAINNATSFLGDRFYATWRTLQFASPGDLDGDTDTDLRDAAAFQRCFENAIADASDPCQYADLTADQLVSGDDIAPFVDAVTGPTATLPAGYVQADPIRGGLLYDRWWTVSGAPEPAGDHPLYPEVGQQSGAATFRCKECHGWDYEGAAGAYGSGSHFTGIIGVEGTDKTAKQIFDLLKADPNEVPNGHDMDAFGMTDADLWDVVKMTLEGVIDTDTYIDGTGAFIGNEVFGNFFYTPTCESCHGTDGRAINFGDAMNPQYVGTIANDNPWEFLHKTRFGHPGAPMPSTDLLGYLLERAADIGVYSQTLPAE